MLRVLIVEDDFDLADVFSTFFSELGHAARVVHTADAALEAVRAETYHLLLLDLVLPDGEGFDVALTARECCGPRILIAAATGFADVDMRDRARDAGCDLFLVKPCTRDILRELLVLASVKSGACSASK